jgi:hypothetical protein
MPLSGRPSAHQRTARAFATSPATFALPASGRLAHAGSPHADLGNLLRFERQPAFADVVGEYAARLDLDPRRALELARSLDLFALVELASRRGQNPVTEHAHELLRDIAAKGVPGLD